MQYTLIKEFSFINSFCKTADDIKACFDKGLFSRPETWEDGQPERKVDGLKERINSPLKKRMSELSLGICNALATGPAGDREAIENDEIYFFTAFGEVETTSKLLKSLTINKAQLVSPTLFHNSVHNTPLGYFTILHKLNNYCSTITDGLQTGLSFIDFLQYLCGLQKPAIITAGDEYSDFFDLEQLLKLDLRPMYLAYRIEPHAHKGFVYLGTFDSVKDFTSSDHYSQSRALFLPKELFLTFREENTPKKIYTDYPITRENPCGICFRLALPFVLGIDSLVVELDKTENKLHCYKVVL